MAQARTEFAAALNQIASEKGVDTSVVIEAIKSAALAAYKKDLGLRNEEIPEDFEEFTSNVNPVTGEITIYNGDKNVTPPGFARIAASIARQVIMQKLNEAEKGAIMSEFEDKVGTIVSGTIQRQEGNTYFVDLGRAEGVMPPSEQTHGEYYHQNQRLKFLIKEIRESGRGPEVIVSRSDANLVKKLFTLEVPELQAGNVEIKAIAREAGGRTKLAATSTQDGVDPVGSLVGQKGVRVQAVMQELGEEKIDIIAYSEDIARFITAALSPAKEVTVQLDEETKVATVTVPSTQLSLAIGKGGQNVRLAAKLTGWKIDIVGAEEEVLPDEVTSAADEMAEATDPSKTVGEAVAEVAQEEDANQAEPEADPAAATVAEADITAEDEKEQYEEKRAAGLGSPEETKITQEGDTLAFEEPSKEQSPTVVNTSETPDVSPVEPPFKEPDQGEEASDKNKE